MVVTSFKEQADGVIIIGCRPGECHYATDGNAHAYGMTLILKKIFKFIGVEPRRLRMEFLSSAEGTRFAEVMQEFINEVKELGPIGKKEGLPEEILQERLEVLLRLIPYIKLVERERLRFTGTNPKEIEELLESKDTDIIFKQMILDKLRMAIVLEAKRKGIERYEELKKSTGEDEKSLFNIIGELESQGFLNFQAQEGVRACTG